MSGALQRSGNRMDEALAKLREEGVPGRNGFHCPSPSMSYTSGARTASRQPAYLARSVCAIYDLWFVERFELQASGLYRMVETIRIHPGERASRGDSGDSPNTILKERCIEGPYLPCPWCNKNEAKKRFHCSCKASVCGGRAVDRHFICRDSCGDEWDFGPPAREIQVSQEQAVNDWTPGTRHSSNFRRPPEGSGPTRLLEAPLHRR